MSLRALVLCLVLTACGGGASTSAEPGGRSSTNGGDASGRVLLRIRAHAGANYATDTRVESDTNGIAVRSSAIGTLSIVAVDEAAGRTTIASTIRSMDVTDASGAPVPGASGVDLSGVVFTSVVDTRGTSLGEVAMSGTTATNQAFAESMRSTMSQLVTHLPEEPVGIGDTWTDGMDVSIPIASQNLMMHCDLSNRLTSFDDTGPETLAVVAVTGTCAMGPSTMSAPTGPITAELRSTSTGETRIALSDGLARRTSSRSDMSIRMSDAHGTPLVEMRTIQDMVTTTRALGN